MSKGGFKASTPTAPLQTALNNMTVSQTLLQYMRLEGVEFLFGVPGGAVIFITDELKKQNGYFNFIVCRQETGAAYMADGYHRVTDKLGVVLTTAGPSAINALTGAINADTGGSAVMVLTGEVPEKYFGQAYLQEGADAQLDVVAVYRNALPYSALIASPDSFQTLLEEALRVALSIPRRTTHLSIPSDVAGMCVNHVPDAATAPPIAFPTSPAAYRTTPAGCDRAAMAAATGALTEARKPLLFLGNGARRALQDAERLRRLTAFVERFELPVMTTPDGKGIFPESHRLSLRNYGMTPCAWPQRYMLGEDDPDHFDALMVIGSGLGELATSPAATRHYDKALVPKGDFIQIDLDQAVIGRSFPLTQGVVAEAGAAIDAMVDVGMASEPGDAALSRGALIQSIKNAVSPFEFPEQRAGDARPLHPAAAMRVVNELVADGHIFIDAGNCVGWSLNNLVIDPPNRFHIALGMGPMGFAVCAVVGGKIGAPDKDCVAIVGDGAFMMQGSEVSTAAQNKVGAVWIVLYDNDLSMVSQGMGALFPPAASWDDYYKLGEPDLVKYAEGLGADAVAVKPDQGPDAMRTALSKALKQAREDCKPQVLVLHIDTRPMPGYGWPELPRPECLGD